MVKAGEAPIISIVGNREGWDLPFLCVLQALLANRSGQFPGGCLQDDLWMEKKNGPDRVRRPTLSRGTLSYSHEGGVALRQAQTSEFGERDISALEPNPTCPTNTAAGKNHVIADRFLEGLKTSHDVGIGQKIVLDLFFHIFFD